MNKAKIEQVFSFLNFTSNRAGPVPTNQNYAFLDGVFAYQENVVNAFKAAPRLAAYINSLTGTVHAIAHSLGNRIVSAGIQDHSMQADTYFMLNAAVAAEAYDPSLWNPTDSPSNPMVHSDWYGYTNACWASLWFTHWPTSQPLHKLTWRGRFADNLLLAQTRNAKGMVGIFGNMRLFRFFRHFCG